MNQWGPIRKLWIFSAVLFVLLLLTAATSTAQAGAAETDCTPPAPFSSLGPTDSAQLWCRNFVLGEEQVPAENRVGLNWHSESAETYDVYFGKDAGSLERVASTSSLSFNVGVDCEQSYAWRVVAKNDCGTRDSGVRQFTMLACTDSYPEWECYPPEADFTLSSMQSVAGQPVQLEVPGAVFERLGGVEEPLLWDFDDGNPHTPYFGGSEVEHFPFPILVYDQQGTFEIELKVRNAVGSDSITKQLHVAASSPLSLPEGLSAFIGEPVDIEAQATGCTPAANGWLWDLAGGEAVGAANGATVSAVWSTLFPWETKIVVVRNTACGSAVASMPVFTAHRLPLSGPTAVQVGEEAEYSVDLPSDPLICSPPPSGYRFRWFVDGRFLPDATADRITVTWESPGARGLEVMVDGCWQAVGILPVYVGQLPINGPDSGEINEVLEFSVYEPNCKESGWSWEPIGGEVVGAANRETVSVRWPTPGSKQIVARNVHCSALGSRNVVIGNPTASLLVSGPSTAGAGEPVEFSAFAFGCSPAAGGWSWTAEGGTILSGQGSDSIVATWSDPGARRQVTVSNSGCGDAVGEHGLEILPGAQLRIDGHVTGQIGEEQLFRASATGCTPDEVGWEWNLDGGEPVLSNVSRETMWARWWSPGDKTVTVRNSACGAALAHHEVTILDYGPDIRIRGPRTVQVGDLVTLTATATGCAPDEAGWTWHLDRGTIHSGEGSALIEATWSVPDTYEIVALNSACAGARGSYVLEVLPDAPRILDVERQLQGFFLEQTPLENRFRVKMEWNGTPGEVRFSVNGAPEIVAPGDESGASHIFRMDRDFPASLEPSRLTIVAINGAGQTSEPRNETIVVSPYPQWLYDLLNSGAGIIDELVDGDAVNYRIEVEAWPSPPLKKEVEVPPWVPFIGGKVGLEAFIFVGGEVSSRGTGSGTVQGEATFTMENKAENLKTEIVGRAGGSADFRLFPGLELTAGAGVFSLQGSVEREKRLTDVVPGLRGLESQRFIGGFVKRLNKIGKIKGSVAPKVDFAAQWVQDSEGNWEFSAGTGGAGLELKGGVGVKFQRVKGDFWLAGGGSFELGVPSPFIRSVGVDGAVGATFELDLLLDVDVDIEYGFHCKWPSPGMDCRGNPATAPLTASLLSGDGLPVRPILHDYTLFGKPSELRPRTAPGRDAAADGEIDLISNIFPGASPVSVELDSGTLLLWEHQDTDKPVHQSLDIAWSVDRGDGWSEPARIVEDTRVELSPVAAADARGRVAAAWLRIRDEAYPGPIDHLDEVADFYRHLEVVAAVFDPVRGTWSDPAPLTEDERMDGDLRLATDGTGRLMLTWLSNSQSEMISTAAAPSRLLASFWNAAAGRWAPPRTIADGLVGAVRHASAIRGNKAFILLEQDTGDGGQLELFRWNGQRWSADGTFAAGHEDRSPQIAFDATGQVHVVWLRDAELVHATLEDPMPVPVLASSAIGLFEAQLLASPTGPLALVWPELGKEGSADPTALFWDPASRTWSEPRPLDVSAAQAQEIDGVFDRQGRLRLAYVSTEIERRTKVIDVAGQPRAIPGVPVQGRSDLRLLQHTLSPDPAILEGDFTLEPVRPFPGDPVQANVLVRNEGDLPASDLTVKLFAGQAGPEGQLLGSATISGPVAGGASVSVSFDVTYPASGGNLIALVEPVDGERSADNNQALVPLANEPPVAVVEASATSGPAPLNVTFDASASIDPEDDELTFHWIFADGTAGAEGPQVSHTFQFPGVYPVTVLVSDGKGSRVAVARVEVGAAQEECGSGGLVCLGGGRFHVRASWKTAEGGEGTGKAVPLTGDTSAFWFFDPKNLEVAVKIVDGCGLNDRFWIFAAGMTNVEVELTVHDTWSGETRIYRNPLGAAFEPIQDTSAFATCEATAADLSLPEAPKRQEVEQPADNGAPCGGPEFLCLGDGRFRARIEWRTSQGEAGLGKPRVITAETGYFSFFDEGNVEVMIKVVEGCPVNGRHWVFAAGLTDVATVLTIEDLLTGETTVYTTPGGTAFPPIQDTSALARCP